METFTNVHIPACSLHWCPSLTFTAKVKDPIGIYVLEQKKRKYMRRGEDFDTFTPLTDLVEHLCGGIPVGNASHHVGYDVGAQIKPVTIKERLLYFIDQQKLMC